jgi:hypothetical protein
LHTADEGKSLLPAGHGLILTHKFSSFSKDYDIMNNCLGCVMSGGENFNRAEEFADMDFNDARFGKAVCADDGNAVQAAGQFDMDKPGEPR